jgi:hypothetical protein
MASAASRTCAQGRQRLPLLPGAACAADTGLYPVSKRKGLWMIWTSAIVIGAIVGATTALKRGGRKLDALQYAAGYAIAFGLVGLAVSILLDRIG